MALFFGCCFFSEFLALFENPVQPKIKRPSSTTSSASKSKKPAANAVKVLWQESVCVIVVSDLLLLLLIWEGGSGVCVVSMQF